MAKLLLLVSIIVFKCSLVKAYEKPDRIAGGKQIFPGQFPFFVQLRIIRSDRRVGFYKNTCGGTLIAAQWILTAGHCFAKTTREAQVLVVGRKFIVIAHMDTTLHYSWRRSDKRPVNQIVFHPDYFAGLEGVKNDVALAHLKITFLDNPHVSTVSLSDMQSPSCKKGVVVGVEKIRQYSNQHSNFVLYTNVTTSLRLSAGIKTKLQRDTIFYSYVISQRRHNMRDPLETVEGHTLPADSGGPFLCYHDNYPVQYGIISEYLRIYSHSTVVSIYEYTSKHLDFIRSYVRDVDVLSSLFLKSGKVKGVRRAEEEPTARGQRMHSFHVFLLVCIFRLVLLIK